MANEFIFTSESVSEGHPDKMSDQVSDAVLDAILSEDRHARVACETVFKTGMVMIAGEITTSAKPDYEAIMRNTIKEIGYNSSEMGFDWETCAVMTALGVQSPDINQGVDRSKPEDQGAGDQGIMFGYATNETEVLMPAPIQFAHRLVERQAEVRKKGVLPWLRPDAKSQVSFHYRDGRPVSVDAVVLSSQHSPDVSDEALHEGIMEEIVKPVLAPTGWLTAETAYHINPTGRFEIGGPMGDAGLTGRKIIVDTYGGAAPHGGGAFSGKDPTKVDRSAAYAARYLAKNVVAAGLAERCTLQLSYAIGVAKPLSIYVDTHGTGQVDEAAIEKAVAQCMDLTPRGIRTHLGMNKPIFQRTAAYGHFGRQPDADGGFSWERTDLVEALKAAV